MSLPENGKSDQFGYEINVWTGALPESGTTSRVTISLEGSNANSGPRYLVDARDPPFARGSIKSFILTTNEYLGDIHWVRYADWLNV